jgi:predicted nucleic acid-binding protein
VARARRKAKVAGGPPARLVLDSGAVIAWSRGAARARALLLRALELGMDVRVPVAVLAETLRGGPADAPVHRVLKAVGIFATPEMVGRLAGRLLGRASRSSVVDALVAAEAVALGADVVTGDPDDLASLLVDHPRLSIVPL